jgi:hypothetical protein
MLGGEDFEIFHGLSYAFDIPGAQADPVPDTTGL